MARRGGGSSQVFLVPPPPPGNTYYVAPPASGGSDASPGTLAQPFATVGKGASVLTPGDTAYLRAGTYAEALSDASLAGGTSWGAPVTIAAYPGEAAVLQPGSGVSVVLFQSTGRQYVILKDLVLDATGCTADCVKITRSGAGGSSYAHHIRLQGCEIRNAPSTGNGVLITVGTDPSLVNGNEILSCHIHHNGAANSLRHGVYCESSYNTFDGNECNNNGGFGIQQYNSNWTTAGQAGNIQGNVVTRNRCHDNNQSGSGQGGMIVAGTGTLCANNLVYGNTGAGGPDGIRLGGNTSGPVSGALVYNNTVYGQTSGTGINVKSLADSCVVRNNICYNNTTQYTNGGTSTVQDHNLNVPTGTTDPLFTNAAAADFHLQAASPAIDAGVSTAPDVTADIEGTARPQGAAYDMGAYEYH